MRSTFTLIAALHWVAWALPGLFPSPLRCNVAELDLGLQLERVGDIICGGFEAPLDATTDREFKNSAKGQLDECTLAVINAITNNDLAVGMVRFVTCGPGQR